MLVISAIISSLEDATALLKNIWQTIITDITKDEMMSVTKLKVYFEESTWGMGKRSLKESVKKLEEIANTILNKAFPVQIFLTLLLILNQS